LSGSSASCKNQSESHRPIYHHLIHRQKNNRKPQ